jgi:hypothetical protein
MEVTMSKQTAVELFALDLYEKGLLKGNGDEIQELLEQARQMEKEQEAEIFKEAQICAVKHDGVYFKYESIEDYYKSKEVEVESSDNSKGQEYQHALTWVNALKYAIEKMKGLDNSESEDAFRKYYNETYGDK